MANLISVQNSSKSNPSAKPYETVVDDTGRFGCTCRGWTVLKKDASGQDKARFCTHCEDIQKKYQLKVKANGQYMFATNLTNLKGSPVNTPATKLPVKSKAKPTVQTHGGIKIIDYDDDDEVIPTTAAEVLASTVESKNVFEFVDPMLASPMPNLPNQKVETVLAALAKYPGADYALEEKFDGHRVVVAVSAGAARAWSRPGVGKEAIKRAEGAAGWPKHITEEFSTFPDGTYDGECYIPGGVSTDVTDLSKQDQLKFVVFDVTRLLGQDTTGLTYDERRELLEKTFASVGGDNVLLADSVKPTAAYVRAVFKRGGEGAILKRRASTYQVGKRSADWIKIKGLETCLMEVIGYDKGKNGPRSVIKVRNVKDKTETKVAAMGGGKVLLDDVTENGASYIGRKAFIEYQFRTNDGNYRHPRWDRWENQ